MTDIGKDIKEASTSEPLSRLDQEKADLYVSYFFRDKFPNQTIEGDERTAREIINSLPLWKEERKEAIKTVGIPSAAHDMELINGITLEFILESAEKKVLPLVDRIKHERAGPEKEKLAENIRLWQGRQEAAEKAIEIQHGYPPPANPISVK